jgi:hypothetical protein
MKRYMEFTELQRSNLYGEEVEELVKLEMMAAGVVPVDEPIETAKETSNTPKGETYYQPVLYAGYGHDLEIAFEHMVDAEAFLAAPHVCVKRNYQAGIDSSVVPEKSYVKTVQLLNEKDAATEMANSAVYDEMKSQYDADLVAFEEYKEAAKKVSDPVWEDWRNQQDAQFKNQKIIDTWNNYLCMCDEDKDIAIKFLYKAYAEDEVKEACRFLGIRDFYLEGKPETVEMKIES